MPNLRSTWPTTDRVISVPGYRLDGCSAYIAEVTARRDGLSGNKKTLDPLEDGLIIDRLNALTGRKLTFSLEMS